MTAGGHFLHYICETWRETGFDRRRRTSEIGRNTWNVLKRAGFLEGDCGPRRVRVGNPRLLTKSRSLPRTGPK